MAEIEPESPDRLLLSLVALARSEAKHLRECFASFEPLREAVTSEALIILDSRADEETRRVAAEVSERIVTSEFRSFPTQRNRALQGAHGDWVFFIDPDERCTSQLAREIVEVLREPTHAAYRVPRRNYFFGREVRHTGWWPDYQVRLLKRELCRYDEEREVHELPVCAGTVGTLASPLIHYNYENWRQFASKQRAYTKLEARSLHQRGRRARPRSFVGQPLRELKRRLLDYQGYRDGALGIALSLAMALYALETQRQLWLLQRRTES
jgi:(heptosyl)LPS beta-1,4-glucosyltransferase